MTGFLVFAALLVLIAIAFAIVALWRGAPRLAIGLAVALPLAAGGLYAVVGAPKALDPANRAPPATIEDAVARLQAELKDAPENFENLVVMARSQMAIGKFPEAAASYGKALKLQPGEAELAVEYAEARLRSAADRRFPPEVVPLLEAAVAKNPQNQRALFFLGLHRMQSGDPARAVEAWERLLPLLAPDAAATLRPQVAAAREAAGLPALAATEAASPDATSAAGIDIEIRLAPELAAQVPPGATVFVFARAPGGAGPPLAARRVAAGAFPLALRLTDADSPMPAGTLGSVAQVMVQARLSRAGTATAASGDIEGAPVTSPTRGDAPVVLVLDTVRP
jgi:cytochrome c-type biogenesis protein CcmH